MTPVGTDFVVNTELRDSQRDPQVASLPNGDYIVAYRSGDENNIEVPVGSQGFDVLGAKTGGEVLSAGHLLTGFPDIATFADGRYVVVSADDSAAVVACRTLIRPSHDEIQAVNIVGDSLPPDDVAFIRQVLQYLSNAHIAAILPKLNQFQYLIATEDLPTVAFLPNRDKPTGAGTRGDWKIGRRIR